MKHVHASTRIGGGPIFFKKNWVFSLMDLRKSRYYDVENQRAKLLPRLKGRYGIRPIKLASGEISIEMIFKGGDAKKPIVF